MENQDFTDLQKLLRLKRHEAPPPGYHEDFLREFQRRQSRAVLHVPLWRIVWDRVTAAITPVDAPRFAYAAAAAIVLFAAGFASREILSGPKADASAGLAAAAPASSPATALVLPASTNGGVSPVSLAMGQSHGVALAAPGTQIVFLSEPDFRRLQQQQEQGSTVRRAPAKPRYLLDSRPARVEQVSASF